MFSHQQMTQLLISFLIMPLVINSVLSNMTVTTDIDKINVFHLYFRPKYINTLEVLILYKTDRSEGKLHRLHAPRYVQGPREWDEDVYTPLILHVSTQVTVNYRLVALTNLRPEGHTSSHLRGFQSFFYCHSFELQCSVDRPFYRQQRGTGLKCLSTLTEIP